MKYHQLKLLTALIPCLLFLSSGSSAIAKAGELQIAASSHSHPAYIKTGQRGIVAPMFRNRKPPHFRPRDRRGAIMPMLRIRSPKRFRRGGRRGIVAPMF